MENKIIRIPVSEEQADGIFIKIDEKLLNDAGFKRGEVMAVTIKDGRIEIERGMEMPILEEIADNYIKPISFYDGGYKGYEVELKLERHDNYKPLYLSSSGDVYKFLKPLQYEPREKIISMMLDTRNKLVGVYEASHGCIDKTFLTPYEVFQAAYLANSKRIVLAHNHPSGDSEPSKQDRDITDKIKQASEIMNVQLLDHIVIGDGNYTSFADERYL